MCGHLEEIWVLIMTGIFVKPSAGREAGGNGLWTGMLPDLKLRTWNMQVSTLERGVGQ